MKCRLVSSSLLLALLALFLGTSAFAEDALDVQQAHVAFEQAMNAGNADAVSEHIHPEYTSFTGNGSLLNGRFERDTLDASFRRGLSLQLRSKHIEVTTWGDLALVTGYAEGTVSIPSAPPRFEITRFSSMWKKHDGRWKQIHLHQSPLASAVPARDTHPQPADEADSSKPDK